MYFSCRAKRTFIPVQFFRYASVCKLIGLFNHNDETVLLRVVMLPYTAVPTTKINYKHINMILTYVHIYTFNISGL